MNIEQLLEAVAKREISIEDAAHRLRRAPFEDLGFAKIDMHREVRRGMGEVVYGAGKTPEQIAEIIRAMLARGQDRVLITRMHQDAADLCKGAGIDLKYDTVSRVGMVGTLPPVSGHGQIAVVSGGTSDLPVVQEAVLTAKFLGNDVLPVYDVGVAGIHRLFGQLDALMRAKVVVAVAGMEGALASVVAGLVRAPVIAVPTSVGYGAAFGGLAPLLAMLNSCASGVSVVNIDNGFGAAVQAHQINHVGL